jgi:dTDP-D-glucose 4,6-dehydratase
VYERYEEGQNTIKALLSFFKDRIEHDEKYAKNLEKLTTKATAPHEKGYVKLTAG